MKILLVDDDPFIRAYLQHVLRSRGHEVVECSNGDDGLNAALESEFDLAIVDVVMPGMDGVELVSSLRQRAPTLPILGISGGDNESHLGRNLYLSMIREAGASDVLQKPFEESEFLEAIDKILAA